MIKKTLFIPLIFLYFFSTYAFADKIKEINILGNERISDNTIRLFSNVQIEDQIDYFQQNEILKNLYNTNFFENVSVKIENNVLIIRVIESPIIDNISITGIKAKKYIKEIEKNFLLKPRNSYSEILLKKEVQSIKTTLKNFGFYFSEVTPYIEKLENNSLNITYQVQLGDKAKISRVSFIGNKIYKDRKLRNIILSEENKFWKFTSSRKFLNEELIEIDKRLLKNFYLNKGYYNVSINSSFARLINNKDFELIYNIDAGQKIYFNKLNLNLPIDFNKENYSELYKTLNNLQGEPYSILAIEKILDKIDIITLDKQSKY